MIPGRFCWVVALKSEADPLLQRFFLNRDEEASYGGFPIFRNEDASVWLTISGPGKVNSAAASTWLRSKSMIHSSEPAVWINFGIAGGSAGEVGDVFRAGKISDGSSGRSWFPQAVWPKKYDLPVVTIVTVDQPTENYRDKNTLIEMEASGFFPMASKFAGNELSQVFKVVSDTPNNPISGITADLVKKICGEALELMIPILGAMEVLRKEESVRLTNPILFEEVSEKWHFSATNRHQLRRLLQQIHARSTGECVVTMDWIVQRNVTDGKGVIRLLREELWGERQVNRGEW